MKNNNFKIDFIGAGFSRCGTTWLYRCLKEHPEICMSEPKETNFFQLEKPESKLGHYSKFFLKCKKNQIKGEVNPSYATNEGARKKIKKVNPNIKILFIIRTPIERSISQYLYGNKYSKEKKININEKELKEKWGNKQHYYKYLKIWYNTFPKENIYIINLDEVEDKPRKTLENLYSFLEVDKNFIPSLINQKENKIHKYYFPKTHKLLKKINKKIKKSPFLIKLINTLSLNKLAQKISKLNRKEIEKPEISKKTRNYLKNQFKDEIIKLEELTGKDLSSWK